MAGKTILLLALATALVVEDRSDGGTWMTVHRLEGAVRLISAQPGRLNTR